MFCSYIIPTIGRQSLERAVKSILDQDFNYANFEIIIVNDSGKPLPESEWMASSQIRVIQTNRRERSVARNSGAAIAKGEYLGFLDDDDWLLPGALKNFWQLASGNKDAAWLYGGIRIVDEQGSILGEINSGLNGKCFAQVLGGAWAPLQASLINTSYFFRTGGFNPQICGTEDEDLCRRIAYLGDFANADTPVACLFRGPSWNTSTNYLRAPTDTKISRDLVLSEPDAFQRVVSSASSGYWCGRICRVYLSTVEWNIRQRRAFTAASRAIYSAMVFLRFSNSVYKKDFWRGFRAEHVTESLHFVMHAYEQMKGRQHVQEVY